MIGKDFDFCEFATAKIRIGRAGQKAQVSGFVLELEAEAVAVPIGFGYTAIARCTEMGGAVGGRLKLGGGDGYLIGGAGAARITHFIFVGIRIFSRQIKLGTGGLRCACQGVACLCDAIVVDDVYLVVVLPEIVTTAAKGGVGERGAGSWHIACYKLG